MPSGSVGCGYYQGHLRWCPELAVSHILQWPVCCSAHPLTRLPHLDSLPLSFRSTKPYIIATGTTGAAFFSAFHSILKNSTYLATASAAVDWILSKRSCSHHGACLHFFGTSSCRLSDGHWQYILDGTSQDQAFPGISRITCSCCCCSSVAQMSANLPFLPCL